MNKKNLQVYVNDTDAHRRPTNQRLSNIIFLICVIHRVQLCSFVWVSNGILMSSVP